MPRKKATKKKAAPVQKKRRNRRNKDPNRPKRSMSAFMFFSNANRDIVKAQNPGLSFTEIAREIGNRWAVLSQDDRSPYATLAAQDKARYEEEKRLYVPDPKYIAAELRPGKAKKDPNAPKRAMSGFMFFSNHMRPKLKKRHPNIAFLDMGREIGKLWRNMSAAKRKPYMQLAAEDKARYEEEKASYVPSAEWLASQKAAGRKKKKDPNAPKRGMSAYLFFCSAHRKDMVRRHPTKKMTEIASMLAVKWRNTSAAGRKKFDAQSKKDKARYTREKAAYDAKNRRRR